MRRLALAACAIGAAIGIAVACVPADTRPAPGVLSYTVSPSDAVMHGTTTSDGWSISFARVLLVIGNAGLGDQCTIYGEANYDRILDVTHDGGQHLGILHGIGQCDVDYRIEAPTEDAILGEGVTDDDKTRLRTPGGDAYVPLGGVSIEMSGTATRGGVQKRFAYSFRPRVRYQKCALDPEAGLPAVDLQTGSDLVYDVRIEAEAILRDDIDASAPLRFDAFANADTDGDGLITLDELRAVPIDVVRDGGAFEAGTYEVDEAGVLQRGRPILIENFGDYVYRLLLPTIARFRDVGICITTQRRGGD
jgi:hypothetical protein